MRAACGCELGRPAHAGFRHVAGALALLQPSEGARLQPPLPLPSKTLLTSLRPAVLTPRSAGPGQGGPGAAAAVGGRAAAAAVRAAADRAQLQALRRVRAPARPAAAPGAGLPRLAPPGRLAGARARSSTPGYGRIILILTIYARRWPSTSPLPGCLAGARVRPGAAGLRCSCMGEGAWGSGRSPAGSSSLFSCSFCMLTT